MLNTVHKFRHRIIILLVNLPMFCVACRETTLEVLKPPQQSSVDAATGGARFDSGSAIPTCENGISIDQLCGSSNECCSGLCALDSVSALTC